MSIKKGSAVPEFIDPVFAKTSQKRSFSVIQNERFRLVFAKTGFIISGTGHIILDRTLWTLDSHAFVRNRVVRIRCFPALHAVMMS